LSTDWREKSKPTTSWARIRCKPRPIWVWYAKGWKRWILWWNSLFETLEAAVGAGKDAAVLAPGRRRQQHVSHFRRFGLKRDWEIISLLASEMGYPMHYASNQQIWDEMRELCPLFYGVTWEKMGDMGHVQWPCPTLDLASRLIISQSRFTLPVGGIACSKRWKPRSAQVKTPPSGSGTQRDGSAGFCGGAGYFYDQNGGSG
jgi:hypothetical protein